jgi:hypothetical protein
VSLQDGLQAMLFTYPDSHTTIAAASNNDGGLKAISEALQSAVAADGRFTTASGSVRPI